MALSKTQKEKILTSYNKGELKTKSISKDGVIEWKSITNVHRAETSWEHIVEIKTEQGPMVLTGGHHVYTSPSSIVEAENLVPRQTIQSGSGFLPYLQRVKSLKRLNSRKFMYDVTVDTNHNLFLERSKVFVSNCPSRNYHFRPPTSEGTLGRNNRVFSYIWTDEELIEYMERAVDFINLWPPETHFNSMDKMVKAKPAWRQMVLMGAISHAALALTLNWIEEEFSLVGEEEITVYLPSGKEIDITIAELYAICKEGVND